MPGPTGEKNFMTLARSGVEADRQLPIGDEIFLDHVAHFVADKVALDRGCLELMTPEAFGRAFPDLSIPSLPFMGACAIEVASLAKADTVLRQSGISSRRHGRQLVARFPTELGIGAWVFFERDGDTAGKAALR